MIITVNLYAMLRQIIGVSSLEIETDTPVSMRRLIDLACEKASPQLKDELLDHDDLKKGTLLLVDGRNVLFLNGLETIVSAENQVSFFPPGGGG